MHLSVVKKTNPFLYEMADDYSADEIFKRKTQDLVDEMFEILKKKKLNCLSAPEVGVSKRLIVLRKRKGCELVAYFNPVIIWQPKTTVLSQESCPVLPGILSTIKRHRSTKKAKISCFLGAWTRSGKPATYRFYGRNALLIQHAIDHLNGVLMTDKENKKNAR